MGARGNPRILVVDDTQDLADSLAMLLDFEGYDVRTAYDGQFALRTAESFRPDLVLLDINMPELDGYQVARRLREAHADRAMAVLAMSALPAGMAEEKALAAGCDAYVQKPIEFVLLYDVIERHLGATAVR